VSIESGAAAAAAIDDDDDGVRLCRLCKRRQRQLHVWSAWQTFQHPRRRHSSPLYPRYTYIHVYTRKCSIIVCLWSFV